MSVFFYNIFLLLFRAGTHIAALFNPKAQKWVAGRRNIFSRLEMKISNEEKIIWFHCASLGEFEQGRPVIEKLKEQVKDHKILLTFFSPSGYEVQKNYTGADWVFYLPMDGPRNAKRFLEIVNPSLVIFVKYEFWFYYLKKIKYRNIPLLLISALFRPDMSFFKWYGKLQRKMLSRFNHIFVQTHESKKLIDDLGLSAICSYAGDTRFDRVAEIAASSENIPVIEKFISNHNTVIAGSTWPEDEEVLLKALNEINIKNQKLIIAPHEIHEKHIKELKVLFPDCVLYSDLIAGNYVESNVLIINNVGLLSRLYKYATITYIGGGLKTNGVHNVLEAAVYFKPVLFGPYYHKYSEAVELVKSGGGISFSGEKRNGIMLKELIEGLIGNEEEYKLRCKAAGEFVQSNTGATEKIVRYIQEKRLLTN